MKDLGQRGLEFCSLVSDTVKDSTGILPDGNHFAAPLITRAVTHFMSNFCLSHRLSYSEEGSRRILKDFCVGGENSGAQEAPFESTYHARAWSPADFHVAQNLSD